MKNPPLNETPEQRKIRLERAAQELFLDIDSSFGKQATKKAKAETKPKEPALTTFLKESNAIAKAMESPTWKPVAVIHYIIKQQCQCCGQSPECVGGTLVRHSHRGRTDTWDFPRPDVKQFSHLPQQIVEENTKIDACPSCIRQGHFNPFEFATSREELPEMSPVELYNKDHDDSGEEIIIGEE